MKESTYSSKLYVLLIKKKGKIKIGARHRRYTVTIVSVVFLYRTLHPLGDGTYIKKHSMKT